MKNLIRSLMLLATTFAFAGCDPKGAFLGDFELEGEGTYELSTNGGPKVKSTSKFEDEAEIKEGRRSDLVFESPALDGCKLPFNVKTFELAELESTTKCSFVGSNAYTEITIEEGTIELGKGYVDVVISGDMVINGSSVSQGEFELELEMERDN